MHWETSASAPSTLSRRIANLCCGRWCGLWTGPLRRYAKAFSAQRVMPDLAISNHMNYEAILQVTCLAWLLLQMAMAL